jgi:hypothetical protein
MACVYFVQGCRSGLVKIGRATNFRGRLSAIRSQSSEPIRVLGIIETDLPAAEERQLHARFAAERARGEWFRPTPAMLNFIRQKAYVPEDEWSPTFDDLLERQGSFADLFAGRATGKR